MGGFVLFFFSFFFLRAFSFSLSSYLLVCVTGLCRVAITISSSGMDWVVLERRTPSLSYMPLMTCAVRSFPPWQTLVFY